MSTNTDSPAQGVKGKKNNRRKKSTAKAKLTEEITTQPDETRETEQLSTEEIVGEADVRDKTESSRAPPVANQHQSEEPKSEILDGPGNNDTTPADILSTDGVAEPEKLTNGAVRQEPTTVDSTSDLETRLDELSLERQSLQAEVRSLRESLEEIQDKHEKETSTLRSELEDVQIGKEHAETQYRNLLGKLNLIRSQLGERLKADAEELSQAKIQIEELEGNNKALQETNESLQSQLVELTREDEQRSKELSSLRNRMNLSQQNWVKERENLVHRESVIREEFESAKQAMQDWEILAMEERSIREGLLERVSEYEEQLSAQKEAYDRAASERDSQALTVDGLQRALQDIQDARKRELRELVESNQVQADDLRKQLQESEKRADEHQTASEKANKELERALPFEKEVKEKNLLIGKLRHEAVILNDHLTKALRLLRKGKPEDNIDRQIVTNHFLHFLALDRADPKKFQVLQLIAALLNWTDEQREQAGLSRPGGTTANNNNSLRLPLSPFHRTPSTPIMNSEFFPPETPGRKESLAELWSNFLEQEAKEDFSKSKAKSTTTTTAESPGSLTFNNKSSPPT
ncbi:MAG: hypothetical protein M1816_005858 [Peltula sp. TS41687]|nr:MAG: hypothetical protein M1816_005858 [Peltula sp. TS41687]